uniref:zinc-ribbon domain-containing protein n=1 Tax=Candidatus Electronema sp. TaxID=2698783 RepID=UPI004055D37F
MLVICEDCAKKYHIEESRIKGQRAKFACKACGHIIVVEKPVGADSPPAAAELDAAAAKAGAASVQPDRRKTADPVAAAAARGRGKPFLLWLMAAMAVGLLAVGGSFLHLYSRELATLLAQERELRSLALALSLKEAVKTSLLRQDSSLITQETERAALLPGMAYAAVINEQGAAVAGLFNPQAGFDSRFIQQVKEKGFPVEVLAQNGLKAGAKEGSVLLSIGGLPVHDRVLALGDADGEIHIGIPAAGVGQMARQAMLSQLFLVSAGLALLVAGLILFLADWLVVRPARTLTNIANRISLGELDLAITVEGSRELRDLGAALERMRHSVRIAVERLTAKRQ